MAQLSSLLVASLVTLFLASYLSAWTGPTQAPPSGNMAAPINVGTTNQVKEGAVGFNGLAVFGNTLFSGSNRYANFGTTAGESGYGLRDSSGTLEYKNLGGSWQPLGSGGSGGAGGSSSSGPVVWGYLSGPGTLASGHNISSVSYANGITRVNFTTPLSTSNYAVITTRDSYYFNGDGGIFPVQRNASYITFVSSNQGNGTYPVVSGFSFVIYE